MIPISMNYIKKGVIVKPLKVFRINGEYILGIYKGGLSEFDLLINIDKSQIKKNRDGLVLGHQNIFIGQ